MYGRVFESMFTGSMRGSGALVFAVWTYVITTMREDKQVGVQVELRPKNLEFYLGEPEQDIQEAIDFLCKDDPDSTCQEDGGKRLIPVGKFVYRVVSGASYLKIRTEEDLREYRRLAKRDERARKRQLKKGLPLRGEIAALKLEKNGDLEGADRVAEQSLPPAAERRPGQGQSSGLGLPAKSVQQPSHSGSVSGSSDGEPGESFDVPSAATALPSEDAQIGLPPGPEFLA